MFVCLFYIKPKKQPNPNKIISVYRPRVDEKCERLWFVDSGTMLTGEPSGKDFDIKYIMIEINVHASIKLKS